MDAAHLHMEIVNRREWADEAYLTCLDVLTEAGALPGQPGDPGDGGSYDLAVAAGRAVKDMIWHHARTEHRMEDGDGDMTATLYGVFLGHIPDEALGAQFYRSTRERFLN